MTAIKQSYQSLPLGSFPGIVSGTKIPLTTAVLPSVSGKCTGSYILWASCFCIRKAEVWLKINIYV